MYAAGHLLDRKVGTVEVDVFDRLPTPWGLVRGGVASDHLDKKKIVRVFEAAACQEGFRFFGDIEIGRDIAFDELRAWYDAVILAYGAERARIPQLPGCNLPGCAVAGDFVRWLNGHPDFHGQSFDLRGPRVLVIGNGNVALDVARILMKPIDELRRGDIAEHALEALSRSSVEEVWVVGRRGPADAAFNNGELMELDRLAGVDLTVDAADLPPLPPASGRDAETWSTQRKLDALTEISRRPRRHDRAIRFAFNLTPTAVLGDATCEAVRFARTATVASDAHALSGSVDIAGSVAMFSIGFAGAALPGAPFNGAKGVTPNVNNRVECPDGPGVYATGWIARGARGVIGSNKACAMRCVTSLLEDAQNGVLSSGTSKNARFVVEELAQRGLHPIEYRDWQKIDEAECDAGRRVDRPRVKICSRDALRSTAFR